MVTTRELPDHRSEPGPEPVAEAQPPSCGIFETHEDFSKLLAGAHRRRVTTIGAPAVIRHLAFWNPPKVGPPETGTAPPSGRREQGREADQRAVAQGRSQGVDGCIAAVYRALLSRRDSPTGPVAELQSNSGVEEDGTRFLVLFDSVITEADGKFAKCPPGIRPDAYRAIKFSFVWGGIRTTLSFELHTEFLTLTIVLDASEKKPPEHVASLCACADGQFAQLHDALATLASASRADDPKCKSVHHQLYHDVWASAEAELLRPLRGLGESLGKKFVDFRGVALGTRGEDSSVEFSRPFSGVRSPAGTGLERISDCAIGDFDTLWRFITCALPQDTEFTLSRFLKDRAFYATALGVQPEVFVGAECSPLYYLLYEDTLNPLQLGRMISRVHRAGTARIAAIMHFDELRGASDILTAVEGALEKATWELGGFDNEQKSEEQFRDDLRYWHRKAETKLAEISGLRLDGTLDARIERSRYYVQQFARFTSGLRIERVSGFQPYDEFVSQRMGPAFEYIDSLGRIYARVQNDRSLLLSRIQTLDTLYHEKLISDAQRIADIALSCVLAPYYVGYVVSHAMLGAIDERLVWLTALMFGLTMLPLMMFVRSARAPAFLRLHRWPRFAVAGLLALSVTLGVHFAGPHVGSSFNRLLGDPPAAQPAAHSPT